MLRKLIATSLLVALPLVSGSLAAGELVQATATLTLEGARQVMAAARDYAQSHQAPGGAIAVVDAGGALLLYERPDGTFAAASRVSIGKAQTAAWFNKPTKFFEDVVNQGRTTMVALPDFTPLQGGAPNKTHDIAPKAGTPEFDGPGWVAIDPSSMEMRRSNGRLSFGWYR